MSYALVINLKLILKYVNIELINFLILQEGSIKYF